MQLLTTADKNISPFFESEKLIKKSSSLSSCGMSSLILKFVSKSIIECSTSDSVFIFTISKSVMKKHFWFFSPFVGL
jgi:hypothetical protein